jgi:NAD(P)-dependent dehydrogenase (short-subunit alcohol dehydrogenase family)
MELNYGQANDIFSVKGKKAIITGGSKGLGREMAICLLENGCEVYLTSRNVEPCKEVAEYAESIVGKCHYFSCDVTQTESVIAMVEDALKKMGRIDILINSAGGCILKFLEDMDDDSWDKVINMNLRSTFIVTREVVKRAMRPQKYGKIINLSSMKSVFGTARTGHSAYCASKGGVSMLTKQLACETANDNITINAIAPTFIKTAINATLLEDDDFRNSLVNRIPVGRIGEFRDMMGLTLLLASDASEFITGQTILLDGGIAARQE